MIAAFLATLLFFNDQPTWLPSSVDWSDLQGRITPNQLSAAYHIIDGYTARAFFSSEGERGPWPTLSGISRRFAEYDRLQEINSTLRSYPIALTNTPAVIARDFTRWASSVDDDFFAPVPTFAWTQSPDLSPETWNPACRPFDLTYDPLGIFPLQKNQIPHFVPNAIRPFGSQSIASQLAALQYQDGIDLGWQTSIASLAESAYGENNLYSITNSTRRLPNSNYPAPARMLGLVDRLFTGLRPSIECNIVTNRYIYELHAVYSNRTATVTYDLDSASASIVPVNPNPLSFSQYAVFRTNLVSSAWNVGNSIKYQRSSIPSSYSPAVAIAPQPVPTSITLDRSALEPILSTIYDNEGGDLDPDVPYPFSISRITFARVDDHFDVSLSNVNLANGAITCPSYTEDYPIGDISGTISVPLSISTSLARYVDLAQSDSSSLLNTNRCNAVYLAPGYFGWNFITSSSLTTLASAYTASSTSTTTNRFYRARRVSNLTSQTSRFNELKYEYLDELSFLRNRDIVPADPSELLEFSASAFNSLRLNTISSVSLQISLQPVGGYTDMRGTFLLDGDTGLIRILTCNPNFYASYGGVIEFDSTIDPTHSTISVTGYDDFSSESFPYLISDTIFNLQPTIEELY